MNLEIQDKVALSDIRISKARDFLDDAKATLGDKRYKTAINRSYYAALNAVPSLSCRESIRRLTKAR